MELVDINQDLEPKPEPKAELNSSQPSKEWLESKAGYLELTKAQNKQGWKFNFPYLTLRAIGQAVFEQREGGLTYIVQPMRWGVTFTRYEGTVQRSYKDWPVYCHLQLPYGYRKDKSLQEIKDFKVANETGTAHYYRVWADDPYAGSQYAGRYSIPVFALWSSTGTIKAPSKRKTTRGNILRGV